VIDYLRRFRYGGYDNGATVGQIDRQEGSV